jgi:hypothetical protein
VKEKNFSKTSNTCVAAVICFVGSVELIFVGWRVDRASDWIPKPETQILWWDVIDTRTVRFSEAAPAVGICRDKYRETREGSP